jgi:uncharacterized protein (UPF0261 family)
MTKTLALVGTGDTKAEEMAYLRGLLEARGCRVLVIDIGVLGRPAAGADVTRAVVARRGGANLSALKARAEERFAQEVMSEGLRRTVLALVDEGRIDGLLAIGGGQGSAMIAPTLKALPLGFPKLLISTKVTQAGIRPYVGAKDVLVMPPVADLAGLNRLTRKVLANAAGAMAGMVQMETFDPGRGTLVAMSMNGTITDCGLAVKGMLERAGYEVMVFHSIGTGGEALEDYVASSDVAAVIELAINELGNELVGGLASAGPHRFEAAGAKGVPQVIVPGSADFINFLAPPTVPPRLRRRPAHPHNPQATIVRTSKQDNRLMGKVLAEKLNRSRGPVRVLWPARGLSSVDRPGKALFDPEADRALLLSLKRYLEPHIPLLEYDLFINDPAFARVVFEVFKKSLDEESTPAAVTGR